MQTDLEKNGAHLSSGVKSAVHSLGKIWMPGAEGIGPYSGKETIALVVWFASWFILHRLLRRQQWNSNGVIIVFLTGIGLATTLVWPPVFEGIGHLLH
jgi:hypothetical protein